MTGAFASPVAVRPPHSTRHCRPLLTRRRPAPASMAAHAPIPAPRAIREAKAVVVGGGPCGAAAAFTLAEAGVSSVTLLERGAVAGSSGGYSFSLSPRGFRTLRTLPGVSERITACASQPREKPFVHLTLKGMQSYSFKVLPTVFVRRDIIVAELHAALLETHPDVDVRLGARFAGIECASGGRLRVLIDGGDPIEADIVLGCDGVNSQVRKALAVHPDAVSSDGFDLRAFESPSTGLHYRTLYMLPSPRLVRVGGSLGGEPGAMDPHIVYLLEGNPRLPQHKRLTVASMLPAGGEADTPRPLTFALQSGHALWRAKNEEDFFRLLEEAFPHVDVRALFPRDEVTKFVEAKQRAFPKIQRARSFAARFPGAGGALLLGDSAHAFPPDLGQGVNAALEDVFVLQQALGACGENASIADVFGKYEKMREADVDALLEIHLHGFPYQYGQVPWKYKLGFLRVIVLLKLFQIAPRIFSEPFSRRLPTTMPYSKIWKEAQASNLRLRLVLSILLLAVIGAVYFW